jgi:hypothetical protein
LQKQIAQTEPPGKLHLKSQNSKKSNVDPEEKFKQAAIAYLQQLKTMREKTKPK